jgi:hypothetical protein
MGKMIPLFMAFEIKTFNTLLVVTIVLSLQSRLKHENRNGLGECFEILCTFTSVRKCKRVRLNKCWVFGFFGYLPRISF